MKLDRRQFLATSGLCLAGGTRPLMALPEQHGSPEENDRLDDVFSAYAGIFPEYSAGGTDHYTMAAEALAAMGHEAVIPDTWSKTPSPREEADDKSGTRERFLGSFADFRERLRETSWRSVIAEWAPRLAPGITAAAYHGVIRTGHAVRALESRETKARLDELATGLAYWKARYEELPTEGVDAVAWDEVDGILQDVDHPYLDDSSSVGFFGVGERLTRAPIAPPPNEDDGSLDPEEALNLLVKEASTAFLEMMIQKRYRIWLLHTITGPAAVQWLLPHVDRAAGFRLVDYARQSVVAMFKAYGAPFEAREHVRAAPPSWEAMITQTVESTSVHSIKLIDALRRFEREDDPLWRSVAAQWLEWT